MGARTGTGSARRESGWSRARYAIAGRSLHRSCVGGWWTIWTRAASQRAKHYRIHAETPRVCWGSGVVWTRRAILSKCFEDALPSVPRCLGQRAKSGRAACPRMGTSGHWPCKGSHPASSKAASGNDWRTLGVGRSSVSLTAKKTAKAMDDRGVWRTSTDCRTLAIESGRTLVDSRGCQACGLQNRCGALMTRPGWVRFPIHPRQFVWL